MSSNAPVSGARTHGAAPATPSAGWAPGAVVPSGPRAYRRSIRSLGPLVALVPPAVLAAVGLALLRGNESTVRGVTGFLAVMLAAPALAVVGAPLRSGAAVYLAAAAASGVLYLVLGAVAARRATRRPVATWRDFWREHAWLLAGTWCGVALALLAANLVLGRLLL